MPFSQLLASIYVVIGISSRFAKVFFLSLSIPLISIQVLQFCCLFSVRLQSFAFRAPLSLILVHSRPIRDCS